MDIDCQLADKSHELLLGKLVFRAVQLSTKRHWNCLFVYFVCLFVCLFDNIYVKFVNNGAILQHMLDR